MGIIGSQLLRAFSAIFQAPSKARQQPKSHPQYLLQALESRVLLSNVAILNSSNTVGGGANDTSPQLLIRDPNIGTIYAVASGGAEFGSGGIFSIDSVTGNQTLLASFNLPGITGQPIISGQLVLDSAGNLYGSACGDMGTYIYKYVRGTNNITILTQYASSQQPAGLVMDTNGNLFGTATLGFSSTSALFELAKGSNSISNVLPFSSMGKAVGGIVLDSSGNLFGTTYTGPGNSGAGMVYEVVKGSGTITTVAAFNGAISSGPNSTLILDASGNLFGTTASGGLAGLGTMYEVVKGSNHITTLASFSNATGQSAGGQLVADTHGNVYGTTILGAAFGNGALFMYSKSDSTLLPMCSFTSLDGSSINGDDNIDPTRDDLVMDNQGVFHTESSSESFLRLNSSATSAAIGTDIMTQGNWMPGYGGEGYDISQGILNLPSYALLTTSGASNYLWAQNNVDARNLVSPTGGSLAGTWYASSNFTINLNLSDASVHPVAFYFLDWDNRGRAEQIQVSDAATGSTLSTQNISGFNNGKYISLNLSGDVKITLTNLSGPNAVLSGVFFGPASFQGSDFATQGNWQTVYGAGGYDISQFAARFTRTSISLSGDTGYTWAQNNNDARNLATPGDGSIAGAWYSATSFTVSISFTDGLTQGRQVSLYLLDWDNRNRQEQIQAINSDTGGVVDTQIVSNFSSGVYLNWILPNDTQLVFTNLSGPNAVLSGVFTGPSIAASLNTDATTKGNWQSAGYGTIGYNISQGPTSQSTGIFNSSVNGAENYLWAENNGDPRNLALPGGGSIAGVWYASSSFSVDINFTDGDQRKVSFYLLDWDNRGRKEQVQAVNVTTGLVMSTQVVSNFAGGEYLNFNFNQLSGHVNVIFTNLAGPNAVVSGIFYSGAAPTYTGSDSTSQGNWQASHGNDGYYISQGPNSIPSYVNFNLYGQSNYLWGQNNGDPRNLNLPGGGSIAGTWYSGTSMTIDLNFTDSNPHQFSAYFLDWDNQGRAIQAQVTDVSTGQVLSTQKIVSFAGGKYVSWNLSGHVQITLTPLAGPNVVLSGVFFGV